MRKEQCRPEARQRPSISCSCQSGHASRHKRPPSRRSGNGRRREGADCNQASAASGGNGEGQTET
eukprot:6125066-Lingulodinium_polyedra.AAC.1